MAIATMRPKPNDSDIYLAGLATLGSMHKTKPATEHICDPFCTGIDSWDTTLQKSPTTWGMQVKER